MFTISKNSPEWLFCISSGLYWIRKASSAPKSNAHSIRSYAGPNGTGFEKNWKYLKLPDFRSFSNLISHAMAKIYMSYEVTSWKLGQLENGITTGPIWDCAVGDMTKLLPGFSQMLVNCKSERTDLRSINFQSTAQYTKFFFQKHGSSLLVLQRLSGSWSRSSPSLGTRRLEQTCQKHGEHF